MEPRPESYIIDQLASPLTIDQAFARAYTQLRGLTLAAVDLMPDAATRRSLEQGTEAVAEVLEHHLSRLFYGPELAHQLARPA